MRTDKRKYFLLKCIIIKLNFMPAVIVNSFKKRKKGSNKLIKVQP